MLAWTNSDSSDVQFDGTISGLIRLYETHKRSPFKSIRYHTRMKYARVNKSLNLAVGKIRVRDISFERLCDWRDEFAKSGEAQAAYLVGQLKRLVRFGAVILPRSEGCHDLCSDFENMRGMLGGSGYSERKRILTYDQAKLIVAEAHRQGWHSVALIQAFMTETGVRQKDMLGEWVPHHEPGTTDVISGGSKWRVGARWEEIDDQLIWAHRLSKSIRGQKGIADRNDKKSKVKYFDLKVCPLVMRELQSIQRPASGPIIVNERTGLPWECTAFMRQWRQIARASGIADDVQNRDTRAGVATEAMNAQVKLEVVQKQLGHHLKETTKIYVRNDLETHREIMKARTKTDR